MPMLDAAALAFLVPGLLFMAIGTPLALRKVAPDAVIGLRTGRGDRSSWYSTSEVYGFDLIVAGAVVATTAIANAFAGLGVAFNVSVLVSSLLIAVAHSSWTSRRS